MTAPLCWKGEPITLETGDFSLPDSIQSSEWETSAFWTQKRKRIHIMLNIQQKAKFKKKDSIQSSERETSAFWTQKRKRIRSMLNIQQKTKFYKKAQFNHQNGKHRHFGHKREREFITYNRKQR